MNSQAGSTIILQTEGYEALVKDRLSKWRQILQARDKKKQTAILQRRQLIMRPQYSCSLYYSALQQQVLTTALADVSGEQNLLIFYSNDVIGETEPCG